VGADKTCTTGDKYAHKGSLRAEVDYLVALRRRSANSQVGRAWWGYGFNQGHLRAGQP
jgi:hypothetical protein